MYAAFEVESGKSRSVKTHMQKVILIVKFGIRKFKNVFIENEVLWDSLKMCKNVSTVIKQSHQQMATQYETIYTIAKKETWEQISSVIFVRLHAVAKLQFQRVKELEFPGNKAIIRVSSALLLLHTKIFQARFINSVHSDNLIWSVN